MMMDLGTPYTIGHYNFHNLKKSMYTDF